MNEQEVDANAYDGLVNYVSAKVFGNLIMPTVTPMRQSFQILVPSSRVIHLDQIQEIERLMRINKVADAWLIPLKADDPLFAMLKESAPRTAAYLRVDVALDEPMVRQHNAERDRRANQHARQFNVRTTQEQQFITNQISTILVSNLNLDQECSEWLPVAKNDRETSYTFVCTLTCGQRLRIKDALAILAQIDSLRESLAVNYRRNLANINCIIYTKSVDPIEMCNDDDFDVENVTADFANNVVTVCVEFSFDTIVQ